MSEQAYDRFWDILTQPTPEDSETMLEHALLHAVDAGEITSEEAVNCLADYYAWKDAGEPELSTLPPPYIFK